MNTVGFLTIEPWYLFEETPLMRDLLYFDKLIYSSENISRCENICDMLPFGKGLVQKKMKEIEIYSNAGLINEYSAKDFKKDHPIFNSNIESRKLGEAVIDYRSKEISEINNNDTIDNLYSTFNSYREICELKSRIFSVIQNEKENDLYIPIIREKFRPSLIFKDFTPSNTISIVMKKFPILDKELPFEMFLDFKQNPDTKLKLSRLKNWISEIANTKVSGKEIEQKLEFLLIEYSNHLDFHKLKYSQGVMETIISTSLSVIENVLQLKLSDASKVLFDIKRKRIDLLESERNALGKEVAYIHKLEKLIAYNKL
ncbi:hypothetical protein AAFH68_24280 [Flavobacterium sp. CGRL1]